MPSAGTASLPDLGDCHIAVIGLGYVGLPLAVELALHYRAVGFDTNPSRIEELKRGRDRTGEVSAERLQRSRNLSLTCEVADIAGANVYVVTVPTPIDANKRPDLQALLSASRTIGGVLERGNVVIFESTVYPGATDEICAPALEAASGLVCNTDFFVGYSPERINPGDSSHSLTDVIKVTSGSTPQAAEFVDALYRAVVTAGTHKVSSIRVAEAAKIIENTQRDLNIALVNELSMIFKRLGVDTHEVLAAAGTKWNFLPFRPGLVGGHCIGVDPYYLTFKAEELGYHPEIILAGRRINDRMGEYVAEQLVKLMTQARINVVDSRVLILGLAFKENCPDIRNSRVVDLVRALTAYNIHVDVTDPRVDPAEARDEYGIELLTTIPKRAFDAVVLAVAHDEFRTLTGECIDACLKNNHVVYDIKGVLPTELVTARL